MTDPPSVAGLDLSLTSTGIACTDGRTLTLNTGLMGTDRLRFLRDGIVAAVRDADHVIVEGPAYNRPQGMHALGQLAGVIYLALDAAGLRWTLVAPSVVKKYATGRGTATKNEVLVAAVKRLGYDGSSDDEADALWLRAVGRELSGHPLLVVPATHRAAIAKVTLSGVGAA